MKQIRWWLVLGAVVVALAVAAVPGSSSARTPEERVTHLAMQVRCPTCAGLAVEQSTAPLAISSKEEIRQRVQDGQSDEQIRAYFVSRYGSTALMSPEKTGINRVPWILPVLLAVAGLVMLATVVRRWRSRNVVDLASPTAEDRMLVESALRARA
jgi:cytochrome c-type biogenesis protein CcmH